MKIRISKNLKLKNENPKTREKFKNWENEKAKFKKLKIWISRNEKIENRKSRNQKFD